MDPTRVWPDFDPARVIHEDDAIVVVDKPAGVPSQATVEGGTDDVPSRLRAFLSRRDGVPERSVVLGIHQRLDRATSGLLVYARRKEANKSLAEQFEGRTVEKDYVACVVGWPAGRPRATLRHRLAEGEDGRATLASPRDPRGKEAITEVEVVERSGPRALLALRLRTGRTHQARAQLSAEGAPIGGDRLYGMRRDPFGEGGAIRTDTAAPRLMLHARGLSLRHPTTGAQVRFEAPLPRPLRRFLERGDVSPLVASDREALVDAVDLAREQRHALGRSEHTTAFRLLHEGGDGVPGVAVDVYGDHLVAHVYDDEARAAESSLLDVLEPLGFDSIYVKRRPKQANVLVDTRTDALAPAEPVRGRRAPDEFEIREHGLPFLVRLGDGLSTGIFLDQRENRRRVRELAKGKRVLNLFAYTCAFSVAAAAGGAERTVSVDAARGAIERGERGLRHAGFSPDGHELVVDDVFDWIEHALRRRDRFDLVILDPPSYSTVGKSRFSTESDYRTLAARVMGLVADGGALLSCTNHRKTVQAKLRRLLHEGAREAGRTVLKMKDLPPPQDFPPPWGLQPHLKSVLVTLGATGQTRP